MVTVYQRKLLVFFILSTLAILALSCSDDDNIVNNSNHAPAKPTIDAPSGSPTHNSSNVSITPVLRWKCSDSDEDKLTYNVYFGRTSTPPLVSSNQSTTSFRPDALDFSKRYYWKIIAKDEHGATTTSDTWYFTTKSDPVETISQPSRPTGPDNGSVNQILGFSTGGSSSSLGHSIEYRFDWNDGSYSSWTSSASVSHSWSLAGTYSVKVQARCRTHQSRMSSWSGAKIIVIGEPDSPVLAVSPNHLDFLDTHTSLTYGITNTGTGTLTWSIPDNRSWISVSPTSGSTTSETDQITVTVDRGSMAVGTHTGAVSISSDGGPSAVTISMEVPPDPCNIVVTNPTSSSVWTKGTTQTIRWSSSGASSHVKIEFMSCIGWLTLASSTPNDGSFSWAVDNRGNEACLGHKIRIVDIGDNICRGESGEFTIRVPEECDIDVAQPTAGSFWTKGETHTIQWDRPGDCGTHVSIELYKGGSRIGTISTSTPNDGSRSWTVDDYSHGTGTNYRVKATDLSTGKYDYSADFIINVPEPCSITVTSPSASAVWYTGENRTIEWSHPGGCGSSVQIELYKSGPYGEVIVSSTSNDGSRSWIVDVPGSGSDNDYRIKVTDLSTGAYDYSDSFRIWDIEYGSTYLTGNAFLTIPDNGGSANRACVSLATDVPGTNAQIDSVRFEYAINHTYVGDLVVYLETGSTRHILWDREGGSGINIVETVVLDDWKDFSADRTWNWCAADFASGDEGQLAFWKMTVYWRRSL